MREVAVTFFFKEFKVFYNSQKSIIPVFYLILSTTFIYQPILIKKKSMNANINIIRRHFFL